MDSEKLLNLFKIEKDRLPNYLLDNYFTYFLITIRHYCYRKYFFYIYTIVSDSQLVNPGFNSFS